MSLVARRVTGLWLALAIIAGASGSGAAPQPRTRDAGLRSLESVDQLKAEFNRSGGQVRLILLLSPT